MYCLLGVYSYFFQGISMILIGIIFNIIFNIQRLLQYV